MDKYDREAMTWLEFFFTLFVMAMIVVVSMAALWILGVGHN